MGSYYPPTSPPAIRPQAYFGRKPKEELWGCRADAQWANAPSARRMGRERPRAINGLRGVALTERTELLSFSSVRGRTGGANLLD